MSLRAGPAARTVAVVIAVAALAVSQTGAPSPHDCICSTDSDKRYVPYDFTSPQKCEIWSRDIKQCIKYDRCLRYFEGLPIGYERKTENEVMQLPYTESFTCYKNHRFRGDFVDSRRREALFLPRRSPFPGILNETECKIAGLYANNLILNGQRIYHGEKYAIQWTPTGRPYEFNCWALNVSIGEYWNSHLMSLDIGHIGATGSKICVRHCEVSDTGQAAEEATNNPAQGCICDPGDDHRYVPHDRSSPQKCEIWSRDIKQCIKYDRCLKYFEGLPLGFENIPYTDIMQLKYTESFTCYENMAFQADFAQSVRREPLFLPRHPTPGILNETECKIAALYAHKTKLFGHQYFFREKFAIQWTPCEVYPCPPNTANCWGLKVSIGEYWNTHLTSATFDTRARGSKICVRHCEVSGKPEEASAQASLSPGMTSPVIWINFLELLMIFIILR